MSYKGMLFLVYSHKKNESRAIHIKRLSTLTLNFNQ